MLSYKGVSWRNEEYETFALVSEKRKHFKQSLVGCEICIFNIANELSR